MNLFKEWAAFITLSVFAWGTSFLWIKIGVEELGPFMLVMYRLFFGLVIIWPAILLMRKADFSDLKPIAIMVGVGLINTAIPFTLISFGEQYIDSGLAGILNGTVPLFTILIAHLALHDDRFSPQKGVGLVLGFVGLIILLGGNFAGYSITEGLWGQLAIVGASILYATSSVVVRRFLRGQHPLQIAAVSMSSAFVFISIATPIFEGGYAIPQLTETWIAVLWLGMIGTAIAYMLYFYLIQSWGPTRSTMVTYVMPVAAVILGVIFLNESLTTQIIIGGLLIITGVAAVNYRRRKELSPQSMIAEK